MRSLKYPLQTFFLPGLVKLHLKKMLRLKKMKSYHKVFRFFFVLDLNILIQEHQRPQQRMT